MNKNSRREGFMDKTQKLLAFKSAFAYILLFLGVQFICAQATLSIAGLIVGAEQLDAFYDKYTTLILAASEVLTILTLILISKLQKRTLGQLLGENGNIEDGSIKWLLLAGFFGNMFTTGVMSVLPIPQELMDIYGSRVGELDTGLIFVNIIAVGLLAPIAEELIFRGAALSRFKQAMSSVAAVVMQAAIFGLIHGTIIWIIYATFFGIILGYVRVKTGTVVAPITLHIAFNTSSFVLPFVTMLFPQTLAMALVLTALSGIILAVSLRKTRGILR